MLQKFALAFKTKTIEFFADEDDDNESISAVDLSSAPEEIITGQRVVVLKPDTLTCPNHDAVISSVFAAVSSFRTAYLHLQTAHSPFDPDAIRTADRAAVSHLHRFSDFKRSYYNPNSIPNPYLNQGPSFLEAQVQENQSLLRTFETVVNCLQADIDRKDDEAAALKQRLRESEDANSKLARKLKSSCSPPEEKVEALLSVGVFDSVLKESCQSTHQFTRELIGLMKKSGWDLDSVANSFYSNVDYAKPGHCRYAILSYICLGMFAGFDSSSSCCEEGGIGSNFNDVRIRRKNSLRQFMDHSTLNPLELMSKNPNCDFVKFCEDRYQQLISTGMKSSFFGDLDKKEPFLGSLRPSNPLYESFVNMCSSVWMLHKLALAYDPVVEIFQVGRGREFSMVYMESVVRRAASLISDSGKALQLKVGFTVVPGFRIGKTVIQCQVYLDGMKQVL